MVSIAGDNRGVHCPALPQESLMHRILVSVVCTYWIVGFAFRAAEIAGFGGTLPPDAWSVATLASIACMVAAALFCWLAIVDLDGVDDGAADIGGLAVSTGIVTLMLTAGLRGMPFGQLSSELGVHIAALCVTYLVVRPTRGASVLSPDVDGSREQARRMAIGAAHGSMLSRFSRRGPHGAGSEA